MGRTVRFTLLASALVFAIAASPALASGVDVIRDCTDNGRIDDAHGPRDYQDALDNLPSDVDEYTDCRQIIGAAARNPSAGSSGGGSGSGGGGSSGSSSGGSSGGGKPGTQAPEKPKPQGKPVVPPDSGLASKPLSRGIPTPVIVMLVLLGLSLIAAVLVAARNRGVKLPMPVLRVVDRVFPRRA